MRREEKIEQIARDCIYFKGDRPCKPHQKHGHTCRCPLYNPRSAKILIIELSDAARQVRSTALVARLKADDPNCHITYLSNFPELLTGLVEDPVKPDAAGIFRLQMEYFDCLYNLDLDKRACALTNLISADQKKGFYLQHGNTCPLDEDSQSVYLQTIMPRAAKANRPGRLEQMFLMCDMRYRREVPHLRAPKIHSWWSRENEKIVGLHTSAETSGIFKPCWEEMRWVNLIEMLRADGLTPVLLGDTLSHRFNWQIAQNTDVTYPGPLTFSDQLGALSQCDVVVSADETVQEIALSLGKEVLMMDCHCDPEIDLAYAHERFSLVPSDKNYPAHRPNISEVLPDEVFHAIIARINHLDGQKEFARSGVKINSVPDADRVAIRNFVSQARRKPQ